MYVYVSKIYSRVKIILLVSSVVFFIKCNKNNNITLETIDL